MHRFKCKIQQGRIVPVDSKKEDLLRRLLSDYEQRNITVTVTLEVAEKEINNEQEKLYRAFILKAADHFGGEFGGMQRDLKHFWPIDLNDGDKLHPSKWTSKQLNDFMDKASALLAQYGFHF